MDPLVSVVCLCYNQQEFVVEALESVLQQTYSNIQLIIVDDCSTDESVSRIQTVLDKNPGIKFLWLTENLGNCAAFNKGFALVEGEFVIDFAADDVMHTQRIEKQVNQFRKLDTSYGIAFSNADYIDSSGTILRNHSGHLLQKGLLERIPEGLIFRDVLSRYFICGPTMIIRKIVLDRLNGYDENLAYEDFDFWVRSSREFKYAYLDEVLTKVRRSGNSMSSGWYRQGDRQLHSTFLVCQKAVTLCRDEGDRLVLLQRVRYEFRQAIFSGNKIEARLFGQLEKEIARHHWRFYFYSMVSFIPLPWSWIRKIYHQWKYG
ncbi:hypothetical protein WSM22_29010 [Cytophagales bacterium WSM2-2]|nr:hypothetical protein WSM22_29010 [Cytophagales bacterium WSM2-2]